MRWLMSEREIYIAVPAWSPPYVELAVRYTIPATLAALTAWRPDCRAHFLVHTDQPAPFGAALYRHDVEFREPAFGPGRDGHWVAFKKAHREAIAWAPQGSLLALLNSDIVVSTETFRAVDAALQGGKKVGISVGIRTLIDRNVPPVGADAETLSRYIWSHRHSITEECVWGSGHTHHPTILFFNHDGGGVSMHCFHLTPMFIVKDRELSFGGTIDDDLLEGYGSDQIVFFKDREFAVAELSRGDKTHPARLPLNVPDVVDFGRRRFRPSHLRNFRQRYVVLGQPSQNHPAADAIIAGLTPHFPSA
jgi:hypothetical protein